MNKDLLCLMNFEIYNVEAAFVIFAKVAELSNKNCHYRTVRIQILSSTQVTFAFTNHTSLCGWRKSQPRRLSKVWAYGDISGYRTDLQL